MRRTALILLVLVVSLSATARGQDNLELGKMWTFENVPRDYFAKEHGFELTDAWLDAVRAASLRFGRGCSASFVSPNGLVMTNHHCALGCIAQAYLDELEGFPDQTLKDLVDATSGGWAWLEAHPWGMRKAPAAEPEKVPVSSHDVHPDDRGEDDEEGGLMAGGHYAP